MKRSSWTTPATRRVWIPGRETSAACCYTTDRAGRRSLGRGQAGGVEGPAEIRVDSLRSSNRRQRARGRTVRIISSVAHHPIHPPARIGSAASIRFAPLLRNESLRAARAALVDAIRRASVAPDAAVSGTEIFRMCATAAQVNDRGMEHGVRFSSAQACHQIQSVLGVAGVSSVKGVGCSTSSYGAA
jgi:hypothetical protein